MNNEPNISLYGESAGEDFPVLKAFQQYIDAEQAKARRRLLTVSIVFVLTLIAVIGIFSVMVIKANEQTQAINDRLVEIVMKDKDRSIEDAKAAAIQEMTVKTWNDTLVKMQQRIEEQDRKAAEAAAAAAKELAAAKAAAEAASAVPVPDPRMQMAEERIQKAFEQLKAEKQKLADEKEKLRQEELERYRREHYPEYYAEKDAFDDLPEVRPAKRPAKARKALELKDDEAIEYFKDAESYTIPVEVKGKRAGWRVPLN